jgi:cell division protein FtsI/penicillin-binding protein 2
VRTRRIQQIAGALLALVLLLAGRLVQLQVLQNAEWTREAIRSRTAANDISYQRGRLLDRDGEVLAEDQTVHDLVWQYRDFRREHVAGHLLEALALLGSDAGGLDAAFTHAEQLAVLWQGVRPRHFALLEAREREDLAFYLRRLGGLSSSADTEAFQGWAASADETTFVAAFPQIALAHAETLARARSDWLRLELRLEFPPGGLMQICERQRLILEEAVQRRVLRMAAGRALGRDSGGVLELLRGAGEITPPAAQALLFLQQRWDPPVTGQDLARLLLEGEPPEMLRAVLQAAERRAPEDVGGLRRSVRFDLHRSRTPVLLRNLDFAATDLLVQEALAFSGFEVRRSSRRAFPSGVAPHLVGGVSLPTQEEIERHVKRQQEFHELARLFDRSPQQETRYRALRTVLESELPADEPRGSFGAEAAFDARLRGSNGRLQVVHSVDGDRPRELDFQPARDGADVRLTLDAGLTLAAERAIVLAFAEVRADPNPEWPVEVLRALAEPRCGFALLDLADGSVPVLATWPTFNPEQYRTAYSSLAADAGTPLMQRALGGNYLGHQIPYPGSTFKPLVAIAALRRDPAAWNREYECTGSYAPARARGGRPLDCDDRRVHGKVNLEEALVRSCNVYFYRLAEDLGYAALHELARELGFGAPTGIELGPGAGGIVPGAGWDLERRANVLLGPENGRDPYNALRMGIGQVCVTASPLQMARFYGWLATGRLLTPKLMQGATGGDFTTPPFAGESRALLGRALRAVVADPRGTAHDPRWPLERFHVAAKTGTAQIGESVRVHAWFTGWFPHERPRYAFAIWCENAGVHGGDLAAVVLYRFLESSWDELIPAGS